MIMHVFKCEVTTVAGVSAQPAEINENTNFLMQLYLLSSNRSCWLFIHTWSTQLSCTELYNIMEIIDSTAQWTSP